VEKQGLVFHHRDGKEIMNMTRRLKLRSKDAAALEEFLRGLRSALGKNLLEAKLFGSKATGRDQPDSDIDMLVVVNRNGAEMEDLDMAFDVLASRAQQQRDRARARREV
jgi:predicted nucleotidyltransferase